MSSGFFITLEGIDGSGKDTILPLLVAALRDADKHGFSDKYANVWVTREPTKITESGKEVARLLAEETIDGEEATRLFIEDRREHSAFIASMLHHSHVLCSRYDVSTYMYQMAQGVSFEKLYALHGFEQKQCLAPDLTIVLDLPVEEALRRIRSERQSFDGYEHEQFLHEVRRLQKQVIETLRAKGRIIREIDANQSVAQVRTDILQVFEEELTKKR